MYAAAGVGPQRRSALIERTALSGRVGWIMPVPSSVLMTCSLCFAFGAFTRGSRAAPYFKDSAKRSPWLGLADFGGLVLTLQTLAPTLHSGDELRKVHLERVEDLIRVVLGA